MFNHFNKPGSDDIAEFSIVSIERIPVNMKSNSFRAEINLKILNKKKT